MTKDEVKLLCETNEQLQWWAVDEFPRIVIDDALKSAKIKVEEDYNATDSK